MTSLNRPLAGMVSPRRDDGKDPITKRPMAGIIAPPTRKQDAFPLSLPPMSGMISTPKEDTFCLKDKIKIPEDKKQLIKKVVLGALGITALITLGSKFIKK